MQDSDGDASPPEPSRVADGFDLAFVPDDPDAPAEITVFPERAIDATTAWLTMDVDHVVDFVEHA